MEVWQVEETEETDSLWLRTEMRGRSCVTSSWCARPWQAAPLTQILSSINQRGGHGDCHLYREIDKVEAPEVRTSNLCWNFRHHPTKPTLFIDTFNFNWRDLVNVEGLVDGDQPCHVLLSPETDNWRENWTLKCHAPPTVTSLSIINKNRTIFSSISLNNAFSFLLGWWDIS